MTGVLDLLEAIRALPPAEQVRLIEKLSGQLGSDVLRTALLSGDQGQDERRDRLWFLESLDRVHRAMQGTNDLREMLSSVLDAVLDLFACDRAWVLYPCNPDAASWRVVMEQTQPEFPGAFALGMPIPVDADAAAVFRTALAARGALLFGPSYERSVPPLVADRFGVRSQMLMVVYPRVDQPYVFGVHHCTKTRPWNAQQKRLFEEIGHGLASALTSVLTFRSLRESERRLDDAQRMAQVGYWDRDLDTGRMTLSDEACRIFGFSPNERIVDVARWHERWLSLLHPDDRASTAEAAAAALRGGRPYEVEYRVVHPGGDVRIVHSRGEVTRGKDGRPQRMFGMMQDITARKQAQRALLESHALLNAVVEGTPDPVFVKDTEGRYLMINSAGAQSLGRTAAQMIGKRDGELFDPETALLMAERDREVIETEQAQTFQETRTTADSTRHYLTTKGVYRGEDGKVVGLFGVSRDVSDLKRLEDQLRQSQKLEAVGKLAGGIAHDFNNLLTVINGCADLALLELGGSPSEELLQEIRQAGDRAATLTRQLLAFSRRQVLNAQVVDLNKRIEQVGRMLKRLIGEDVELGFDFDPALGAVKVDPTQFEQAIINLAVNAREAMPQGGRLNIETRSVLLDRTFVSSRADLRAGRYALVKVTDSGSGMEPATMARIFEPFFTTKPLGKGSGLGLAMVYGFLKQSGGHVEVASTLGEGTTFELFLPLAVDRAGEAGAGAEMTPAPVGAETVLLVEDEHAVRRLCKLVLASRGFRVLEAENGEEALEVARKIEGDVQVLVTDVVMPRIGGRQLAAELRQRWARLRVVFMSGYTDDVVLPQELGPGVTFLQKPFSPPALLQTVRDLLDSSRDDGAG